MIGKARRWLVSGFLLALLAFLSMPLSAAAATTRPAPPPPVRHAVVTRVIARAVPNYVVGRHHSIVTIRVFATAELRNVHTKTPIIYRWVRSDGTRSPYMVKFVAPGQRYVTMDDTLRYRYRSHAGYNWDRLEIVRPNQIHSNLAFFFIRWIY